MTSRTSHWAAAAALGLSCVALATAVWTMTRTVSAPVGPETPPPTVAKVAEQPSAPVPTPIASTEDRPRSSQVAITTPRRPAELANGTGGGDAMQIQRLVVTDRIEHREPAASPKLDADGKPIFAFVELSNDSPTARQIIVTFEHGTGTKVGHVELDVPAQKSRWRTWAKTAMVKKPGDWTAVVTAADGTELARTAFVVAG